MIGQILALAGIAALLWFLRHDSERKERIQRLRLDEYRQETHVQRSLRDEARTGDVAASPVDCPVFPIAMARSRRERRGGRPAA